MVDNVNCISTHVKLALWIYLYENFSQYFKRPAGAGAVLQTPSSIIDPWIKSWFVDISLKLCISQTVRARKL